METIEQEINRRKEDLKKTGVLMSAELAVQIERETIFARVKDLETRVLKLEVK